MKLFFTSIFLIFITSTAHAALNVFACEPEWGALVTELGGRYINVYTATTAQQDPHHIQARPSLIAKIHNADLVVCTGAELEVGWLPVLLQRGANPKVQPGQLGFFEAAHFVNLLGVPTRLDRADGDVHAAGNPHIQTSPENILLVARGLNQRLQKIDPAHQADYQTKFKSFEQRWLSAMQRWQTQAAVLKNVPIVIHHDSWLYLVRWLNLDVVASLEPKPGIPPSAKDLSQLLERLKIQPVKMDIYAGYEDSHADQWLAKKINRPAVMLPFTVGGTPAAKDLFGLFDDTVARLLQAVN